MIRRRKPKIRLFKFQKEIAQALATIHKYNIYCSYIIPSGYGIAYILQERDRLICLQKKNN